MFVVVRLRPRITNELESTVLDRGEGRTRDWVSLVDGDTTHRTLECSLI